MIVMRIEPDQDSHFRLLGCSCGGAAEYLKFDTGMWAAACKACRKRGRPSPVRHTAQVNWNGGGRNG